MDDVATAPSTLNPKQAEGAQPVPPVGSRLSFSACSAQRLHSREVDGVGDVLLPLPTGSQGPTVRLHPPQPVLLHQGFHQFLPQFRGLPPPLAMHSPPGIGEHRPPLAPPVHRPSTLVDEPVVVLAQKDAIAQGGVTSFGPWNHMMGVGEAAPAPREAASPVPGFQGPSQGWRYGAGAAPNVQDGTVRGLGEADDAGVARKAPGRFS